MLTVSDQDLRRAIERELASSGCFLGYRKMWSGLRNKELLSKGKE